VGSSVSESADYIITLIVKDRRKGFLIGYVEQRESLDRSNRRE